MQLIEPFHSCSQCYAMMQNSPPLMLRPNCRFLTFQQHHPLRHSWGSTSSFFCALPVARCLRQNTVT